MLSQCFIVYAEHKSDIESRETWNVSYTPTGVAATKSGAHVVAGNLCKGIWEEIKDDYPDQKFDMNDYFVEIQGPIDIHP